MDIDWAGARFAFRDRGHGIRLTSELITSTETVLRLDYRVGKAGGPFTIDFGGMAQVSVQADGSVTAHGATIVVEKKRRRIRLTLPFPLLETMAIEFSGAFQQTVQVVDHYSFSVGRFTLELRFDSAEFPEGALTLPRTLDSGLSIGTQGYSGEANLGPEQLEVKNHRWTLRK